MPRRLTRRTLLATAAVAVARSGRRCGYWFVESSMS
jgi:hypothetical protein